MQLDYRDFLACRSSIEMWMERETGIKGIEFFACDGDYVGVGNGDRTMKLIQL